jgi:hypothetical protein
MNGFLSPFVKGHLGQVLCQIGACACEADRLGFSLVLHSKRMQVAPGPGAKSKRARKEDQSASVEFVHRAFDVEASDCAFDRSVFMPVPTEWRPLRIRADGRGVRIQGKFENGNWFQGAPGAALHAALRPAVFLADASERDRLRNRAFIHFPADCDAPLHLMYYSRAVAHLRAARPGVVFEIFADDIFSEHVADICDACCIDESLGCFFSRTCRQADALSSMAACGAGGVVSADWLSWWAAFLCCSADAVFAVPSSFSCAQDPHHMRLPNRKCTNIPTWYPVHSTIPIGEELSSSDTIRFTILRKLLRDSARCSTSLGTTEPKAALSFW